MRVARKSEKISRVIKYLTTYGDELGEDISKSACFYGGGYQKFLLAEATKKPQVSVDKYLAAGKLIVRYVRTYC